MNDTKNEEKSEVLHPITKDVTNLLSNRRIHNKWILIYLLFHFLDTKIADPSLLLEKPRTS